MVRRFTGAGCVCLLVVVLAHVTEHWNILPVVGWRQSDSPGHYLALSSAVAGIALLIATLISLRV